MRDFEQSLRALTIRPYDDGRFIVVANGKAIFDMDRNGKFPKYEVDIKVKLDRLE